MLHRCGIQYERRYVNGEILPPAVAMLEGTAVHKGAEVDLSHKMATGELAPLEAVHEAAVDAFRLGREKDGLLLDEEEKAEGEKVVVARAIDEIAVLSALHHRELAPVIEPTHLERTFELELKGYPVNLAGTLDVQEATSVRDLKTKGQTPNQTMVDRSEQLSVYALAVKTLDGKAPETVGIDALVKTKTPKVVILTSTRSDDDFKATLLRVEAAVRVIEAGAFYPADPEHWVCTRKFCGYFDSCPFGSRRRVQV